MPASELSIEVVTPERWEEVTTLFERPGPRGGRQDPASCWCSVWRGTMRSVEENRAALCDLVAADGRPGLLAYQGDEPIGWVSVAPREQFPSLLRSPQFKPRDEDAGVWVITCFHVDPNHRKRGVGSALLDAAVAHAADSGATAVEGYPADPPDYKGRLDWFQRAGFASVREAGKRTVVRKDL